MYSEETGQLLIDIGGLSECCSNHALDTFYKAMSGEDGNSPDIWALHESPFIQRLIELFSQRGLLRLAKVQEELNAWADGLRHAPAAGAPLSRPDGLMLRWSTDELDLVRLYLTNLPPAAFTLDDWGLVIDYLVHRYLPLNDLRTDAEWLSVRSAIMGRVQANIDGHVSLAAADTLVAAAPLTVGAAQSAFNFGGKFNAILEFGRARCVDQVVSLSASTRSRLKRVILEHQMGVLERNPLATRQSLTQKLFDEFGTLNRDWRRIAVTEAGENANQGLIASLAPDSRVRRVEAYKGACAYCKKIDGRVMTVVDPATPKKNGELQVWVGKNNIGRSSAPRRRVGSVLIERQPSERWWVPAGTVHPHCRGSWHVMPESKPTDSPSFQAWLDQHFHKVKAEP